MEPDENLRPYWVDPDTGTEILSYEPRPPDDQVRPQEFGLTREDIEALRQFFGAGAAAPTMDQVEAQARSEPWAAVWRSFSQWADQWPSRTESDAESARRFRSQVWDQWLPQFWSYLGLG